MIGNNRLIFFDIDGTLSGWDGEIPESTQAAIRAAKENGNMVFVATGRSKGIIPGCVQDIGFDGFVLGAGAYVEYNGKEIFHETLDIGKVKALAKYLEENNAYIMYEANEACYVSGETKRNMIKMFSQEFGEDSIPQEFEKHMRIEENIDKMEKINQLNFFGFNGDLNELKEEFGNDFSILPSSVMLEQNRGSGEIAKKGITKATGISHILKQLGAGREDVIAFGDSYNDMEMIRFAGTGVAMGNAVDDLKEAADITAPAIDEDGIYTILKHLDVI